LNLLVTFLVKRHEVSDDFGVDRGRGRLLNDWALRMRRFGSKFASSSSDPKVFAPAAAFPFPFAALKGNVFMRE
jgi:hypothetical protein